MMMQSTPDRAVVEKQRAVLASLVAFADQQEEALDSGDLEMIAHVCARRGQAVREAAPFVPPMMDWAPELADLVAHAADRSTAVLGALTAQQAQVRVALKRLTVQW